jgi:MinD-like ATPase involved in chromosome partitioning or flagellar assembly
MPPTQDDKLDDHSDGRIREIIDGLFSRNNQTAHVDADLYRERLEELIALREKVARLEDVVNRARDVVALRKDTEHLDRVIDELEWAIAALATQESKQ